MRNTIFGLALLTSLGGVARAANVSQTTFAIQGVLRDGTGALQSMAVGLDVNLYPDNAGSKSFYFQHFPTVAVDNGFFTVEVAGDTLSFSSADAWVGVQVGGDSAELPRQHITAVPFAFSAASAAAIQNVPVAASAPKDGDLLRYDATNNQWTPTASSSLVNVV